MTLDDDTIDAIARRTAEMLAATSERHIDGEQAAELLSVPKTWLMAEARADRVPHVRFGRYVRFSASELREWARAHARGPHLATRDDGRSTAPTVPRGTGFGA